MKENEVYYQMESADGRTVRVPKSRLREWLKGKEQIRKGEKPSVSEESSRRLSKLLGL